METSLLSTVISGQTIWKRASNKTYWAALRYSSAGVSSLSKVIRVRYEKGVLKPLEPLELEEGEELILEVKKAPSGRGMRRFFGIIKLRESEHKTEEDYYGYISERGHIPRQ